MNHFPFFHLDAEKKKKKKKMQIKKKKNTKSKNSNKNNNKNKPKNNNKTTIYCMLDANYQGPSWQTEESMTRHEIAKKNPCCRMLVYNVMYSRI